MKLLFKNIDEVRQYISVDVSQDLRTLAPYIITAEKKLQAIIGDTLLEKLRENLWATEKIARFDALLPKVLSPLANYAYLDAVPQLSLTVGDMGIGVTVSQNIEPAAKWRLDEFSASLQKLGDEGLEELIKFLENNKDTYTEWLESPAYSFNKSLFINNAGEFNEVTKGNISRLQFLNIRQDVSLYEEQTIKPTISEPLFNFIKEKIKTDSLPQEYDIIAQFIKKAICYNVLFYINEEEKYKTAAIQNIEELRNFLNKNASQELYTLYYNSESYQSFEQDNLNNEESSLFMFI